MAWAETALEEMGLAQIWVRRGLRPDGAPAPASHDVNQVAVPGAPNDAPEAEAEAATREADTDAGRRALAPESAMPSAAVLPTDVLPLATGASASADRSPRTEPASSAAGEPLLAPAVEAQPVAAHQVREPGAIEHFIVDAPGERADDFPPPVDASAFAEDDFAWFDAAPPADPAPLADSRPAETPVAELDWDALAARVAGCTRCRLCEKRTNTVFGVGDREAEWMLVGEAPGENEDKQGEPFVGQAGKLLDNMLQSLSLKRGENVYIANVIKCRPPGNRNPEPDEVARCELYLQRQVALVKPRLIVALGRFAAQTLLKSDASIASLRGRVHTYEGVPVIVTYHPAYLLRSLQDKSKAWADLCLARDTYRGADGT